MDMTVLSCLRPFLAQIMDLNGFIKNLSKLIKSLNRSQKNLFGLNKILNRPKKILLKARKSLIGFIMCHIDMDKRHNLPLNGRNVM